jgi:hypothetical protein
VYVEQVGRALLVNPGAVCPTLGEQPTVARLQLGAGRPHVEIVPLLTGAHSRLYYTANGHHLSF